jgi:hypothetical protein
LAADGAVDVGGVAEKEDAAALEMLGDPMMYVIR